MKTLETNFRLFNWTEIRLNKVEKQEGTAIEMQTHFDVISVMLNKFFEALARLLEQKDKTF